LEGFIEQLGYEPVLSEKGNIAYDPDIPLDESCYREVRSTDIFVLIIGGRYGSEVSGDKTNAQLNDRYESITKREFETAAERDIPTYIMVEKAVYAEYETFKTNRDNDSVRYAHVDSANVFHFLDHILARPRNNPVFQFERHTDIVAWLREQWAGLFRDFIARRSERKQLASLADQVAELANVGTTLKRYLENVVSKVSAGDADGERLIESEEKRLEQERRKRAALKSPLPQELHSLFKMSEDEVLKVFNEANSLEDLARLISVATNGRVDERTPVKHWRENPAIVEEINQARELLGLQKLNFAGKPVSKKSKERNN
jgi:hypothetical protein